MTCDTGDSGDSDTGDSGDSDIGDSGDMTQVTVVTHLSPTLRATSGALVGVDVRLL